MVFDFRLKMSILRRFLPKRVNLRFARLFHDVGEARRFVLSSFTEVEC